LNPKRDKSRKRQLKYKGPIQVIGKDFQLHTFVRKRPVLRKLGNDRKRAIGFPFVGRNKTLKVKYPRGHLPISRIGGVMKDQLRDFPGVRVLTNGNYTTGSVTVVEQRVNDFRDWLRNVSSTRGDHKRPNSQRFTHTLRANYEGATTNVSGASYSYVNGVNVQSWTDVVWPAFPNSTVYNKAVSRLYDQLRGDIDLSIDLAESHKTKSMMQQTVRAMGNLAQTFRKMKRSNPRDWGNLWLEFTYGWKPLATSIFGAAHKLIVGPSGPRFLTIRATSQEVDKDGITVSQASFGANSKNTVAAFHSSRCKIVCRYALLGSRLDELAGITSLNPVSIAWELTPYSFVVDWFVNIGGYLRDFENACLYHSDFVDGYVSESAIGVASGVLSGSETVFGTTSTWSGKGWERTTEKKRTVLSATPLPRRPRFDPHLGSSRLVSGAALLGQMLHSLEHPSDRKSSFPAASKNFSNWSKLWDFNPITKLRK